uniref:Uncharacterized protein n=1 Tax=Anopheles triannulatus TaxID=58253 RepID=A0A2M4AWB5_9DIPT
MTEETTPVKRPRGRPKKVVNSPAVAANKPQTPTSEGGAGKRGAPKKPRAEPSPPVPAAASEEDVLSDEDVESSNSSSNRPVAVAVPAKKRGASLPEPADLAPTPPKRGRGRPPKKNKKKAAGTAVTPVAPVAGKKPGTGRGRGRPRKNPL